MKQPVSNLFCVPCNHSLLTESIHSCNVLPCDFNNRSEMTDWTIQQVETCTYPPTGPYSEKCFSILQTFPRLAYCVPYISLSLQHMNFNQLNGKQGHLEELVPKKSGDLKTFIHVTFHCQTPLIRIGCHRHGFPKVGKLRMCHQLYSTNLLTSTECIGVATGYVLQFLFSFKSSRTQPRKLLRCYSVSFSHSSVCWDLQSVNTPFAVSFSQKVLFISVTHKTLSSTSYIGWNDISS